MNKVPQSLSSLLGRDIKLWRRLGKIMAVGKNITWKEGTAGRLLLSPLPPFFLPPFPPFSPSFPIFDILKLWWNIFSVSFYQYITYISVRSYGRFVLVMFWCVLNKDNTINRLKIRVRLCSHHLSFHLTFHSTRNRSFQVKSPNNHATS